MASAPDKARDILRYHFSLLRDFRRVLFDAEDLRQTIVGLFSVIRLPLLNWLWSIRPPFLAKIQVPLPSIATWKLGAICLFLFMIWAFMKVNYRRFLAVSEERDKLRSENSTLRSDTEDLFQEHKKLTASFLELLPYKKWWDEMEASEQQAEAKVKAQQPARDLSVKTGVLIREIEDLMRDWDTLQASPFASRLMGKSPDQLLREYDATIASRVLALAGDYLDGFSMTSTELGRLCSERPRTIETIKNIREALDGLRIRLRPMTGYG